MFKKGWFTDNFPEYIVNPVNCIRYRKYWIEANCIFVHVPKAAGSSVSHVIYGGKQMGHTTAVEMRRYVPGTFNSLFKFAVVRNPWDRLYSAYTYTRQGGTGMYPMKQAHLYTGPKWETFETFVYEWLAERKLEDADIWFRPQTYFIADKKDNILVDLVSRVESLNADAKRIGDSIGRPLEFPMLNQSKREIDFRSVYDDKLKNFVGDLYGRDVKLLNYDF